MFDVNVIKRGPNIIENLSNYTLWQKWSLSMLKNMGDGITAEIEQIKTPGDQSVVSYEMRPGDISLLVFVEDRDSYLTEEWWYPKETKKEEALANYLVFRTDKKIELAERDRIRLIKHNLPGISVIKEQESELWWFAGEEESTTTALLPEFSDKIFNLIQNNLNKFFLKVVYNKEI